MKAEAGAGLPKLDGGVCHPLRRKWRSERPYLPMKAVAVAGGWTVMATMEKCYDLPDDDDALKGPAKRTSGESCCRCRSALRTDSETATTENDEARHHINDVGLRVAPPGIELGLS